MAGDVDQGRLETGDWTVWREDDNGARFIVKSGLTQEAAQALAHELQARGHKQHYWIEAASGQ